MAARFQKQNRYRVGCLPRRRRPLMAPPSRFLKNGYVLLKVDRDGGEIELNSRNGGRLVCQVRRLPFSGTASPFSEPPPLFRDRLPFFGTAPFPEPC